MNSAMAMSFEELSSGRPPSAAYNEASFSARLDSLKDLVCSMLSDLDSLGRLVPPRNGNINLRDEVRRFEIELISAALESCRGNQSRAARMLGVKHTTLNAKVKRYQIRLPHYPSARELTADTGELAQ